MDLNTRLVKLMQQYEMSPSVFADEVGIIRSSISHIISGRNKPGVDILQKVLKRFPEISSDWLILGMGAMMRNVNQELVQLPKSDLQNKIPDKIMNDPVPEAVISRPKESVQMNLLDYVGDPDEVETSKAESPVDDDKPNYNENPDAQESRKSKINLPGTATGQGIKRITVYFEDGTYSDFVQE